MLVVLLLVICLLLLIYCFYLCRSSVGATAQVHPNGAVPLQRRRGADGGEHHDQQVPGEPRRGGPSCSYNTIGFDIT